MNNPINRTLADPGNLVLLLIGIMTVLLMLHGDTIIKIPRYRGIQSKESGQQWVLDDKVDFEKLEDGTVYPEPEQNPDWQPPCLPNEDPDYEAKQMKKKIKEDLKATGVEELVESIEKEFKLATKDLPAPADVKPK